MKTADHMRNEARVATTERLLARIAKAIILVLFIGAGVAGLLLGNPSQKLRATMDEECHARCANLLKLHRLVAVSPPGSAVQGRYDGPWKCECY